MSDVSVIVLAYREEPTLERCMDRLLASRGVDFDIVLVDNGYTGSLLPRYGDNPRVRVVRTPFNQGFTGGCNYGANHAEGELLAFVSGDVMVEPDCIARLRAAVLPQDVGMSSASLRLAGEPQLMNSAGNPVHFLGLSWSGAYRENASEHASARDVASVTGACFCMERSLWEELGGFDVQFFSYLEDTDLSLRCWLSGRRVVYEPDAVALHDYEFGRDTRKFYRLERNRIIMVLTVFDRRTLLLALPALVIFEFGVLALSAWQGWAGEKLRAMWWILRHARWITARRRRIQKGRAIDSRRFAALFDARFTATNLPLPRVLAPADTLMQWYWSSVANGRG